MVAAGLARLEQAYDVVVAWRSFELRPAGSAPISPAYRARIEAMRPRLAERAHELYGIELNAGPFGINSRPSLVAAKVAEARNAGPAFHKAAFHAYWERGQNLADTAVLVDLAGDVGLERDLFRTALDDPAFEAAVAADIDQAFAYGLHAVPALIFDNAYLVNGAQPYEVLAQVVERRLAERQTGHQPHAI